MADLMSNIYMNPDDYRIAPNLEISPTDYHKKMKDGVRVAPIDWNVYSIPLGIRLVCTSSERRAHAFVAGRVNPHPVESRLYSDICRCGKSGPAWDYIKTGELIFERCPNCLMPMRHDVMVKLNEPFVKDFDLDNFLEMF